MTLNVFFGDNYDSRVFMHQSFVSPAPGDIEDTAGLKWFTTNRYRQRRAFYGALKTEKVKRPAIPRPLGAMDTNGWCFNNNFYTDICSANQQCAFQALF